MGPFLCLFSLVVEHEFFDDGRLRSARFLPTADTDDLVRRAGLLTRRTSNGIDLYYDHSRIESLQLFLEEAGGTLDFTCKVYVDDEVFSIISEAFLSAPDAIPCFHSKDAVAEKGRLRLHGASKVSEQDMALLASESFSGLLDRRDLRVPPTFVVRVAFAPKRGRSLQNAIESEPERYFVRFGSRPTYWTYFLLGPFVDKRVSVVDLDHDIGFESLGPVSLSEAHPALAFRSTAAIPMRQHSACRFQLREVGSGNGKVLVRRLPLATATRVNRQTIGDKVVSVSEVYVNG